MTNATNNNTTVSATAVTTTTITDADVMALKLERASYQAYKVVGWKKNKEDGTKKMPDVSIRLVRANSSDIVVLTNKKYIYKPWFCVVRVSAMGCSFDVTQNKTNPDKLFFSVTRDFDEEYEEQAAEVKKAPLKACEKFIRERLTKVGIHSFNDLLVLALKANGLKLLNDMLYIA